MTRTTAKASALLLLALLMAGQSTAQDLRPTETLYFTPRVGITNYVGDLNSAVNFENWEVDGRFPISGGLEVGYQYTPNFALGLGGGVWYLPATIGSERFRETEAFRNSDSPQNGWNFPFWLVARFQGGGNVSPFFEIGGFGAISNTVDFSASSSGGTEVAYGPMAGLGLEFMLNPRTAFTIGLRSHMAIDDSAIDGTEGGRYDTGFTPFDDGDQNDFASFDLVNDLSIGLKFHNNKAFTPVDVMAINCPSTLQVGQSGAFTADTDMNATMPVEYRWDFGDGSMGTGLSATHAYDRPGTYTGTFTASNGRSMDTESCTITVVAPPVAAAIVSINSNDSDVCLGETVRFSSNVRGDTPLDYTWNFGDGTTGSGANPTHVYSQPGTYTVSLTIRNNAGSDTATLTQTVEVCQVENPCAAIAELNSVYFMMNSSVLTAEARAELAENVEVLRDCDCIDVRIEGFAGPRERNPQQLSEARANAVMQYYVDNGISTTALNMMGMGRVGATTTKKDDTSQFRRVDSIPLTGDCDNMMDDDDDMDM